MWISFGEQHAFPQDADHPLLSPVRFRIVVWVLDAHMVESIVVCDGKPLCAEWKKIANNRAVFQVPFSIRHADLVPDDSEELAPERESGHSWNFPERRDVERVNI